MKVVYYTGESDLATVFVAQNEENKIIEFVESVQPGIPIDKKWVLIVSTMFGCPVNCNFCDAGGDYKGMLSEVEILWQIDFLINKKGFSKNIDIEKFKIQFARMGEPSLNKNVLNVLKQLPQKYNAPGLMPSISTIAPSGVIEFFDKLIEIKNKYYKSRFQLQFSIHTTDESLRNKIIPVKKLSFPEISKIGQKFYNEDERKVTLNFALEENYPVDINILEKYFSPEIFCLKITPINPTTKVITNNLKSALVDENNFNSTVEELLNSKYEIILSVGDYEENKIGSNCGQYINNYLKSKNNDKESYSYDLVKY